MTHQDGIETIEKPDAPEEQINKESDTAAERVHPPPCQKCGEKQPNSDNSSSKQDQQNDIVCSCDSNKVVEKQEKSRTSNSSSKISMSYSKLKKRKQKSRRSIDRKDKHRQSSILKIEELPPPTEAQGSLLLRLFESKLFTMPIAISYLFNSKESGVLAYLGNRLFVSTIFFYIIGPHSAGPNVALFLVRRQMRVRV